MNKKKVVIISISVAFILAFVLTHFLLDGGRQMGSSSDAKTVREIPEGFILLPSGSDSWWNGLRYVPWESQISFLDVNNVCIYQTGFSNIDFIVKYKNEYYVNEEKILELIDIANSAFEQRIKRPPCQDTNFKKEVTQVFKG